MTQSSFEGPSDKIEDQDARSLDLDELQRDCAPFISFDMRHSGDQNNYVRLTHASASDFLRGLTQRQITTQHAVRIDSNLIAEVCIKMLSQERYSDTSIDLTSTQAFYSYAAKYWHRHVDESDGNPALLEAAGSFVRSRQFMTLTRFQSLHLDRHFGQVGHGKERALVTNFPKILGGKGDQQGLVDDYQHFIEEWGRVLNGGTAVFERSEVLEQCFWGALGARNVFNLHDICIEKNRSVLLHMHTAGGDTRQFASTLSRSSFHEAVSDDGSRVAVWQLLAQRYD
jgi:hypothetical protein